MENNKLNDLPIKNDDISSGKWDKEIEEFENLFEQEPVCTHGYTRGHYICEPHDFPHVLGNRFGPDCKTCNPPPRPEKEQRMAFLLSKLNQAYKRGVEESNMKYKLFHDLLSHGLEHDPACLREKAQEVLVELDDLLKEI